MRVVALGDSITEGYLCYPREAWVHIVEHELGIKTYNLGVCGDLSSNMKRRFRQEVLPLGPSHCIILGGTNDAFCDVSLEEYSENIKVITEYCLSNKIDPIIGIPTPCLAYPEELILQAYRAWLQEYAEANQFTVIDFYSALADTESMMAKEEYLLDDVHPNAEGYRVMADTAKLVLLKILKLNSAFCNQS